MGDILRGTGFASDSPSVRIRKPAAMRPVLLRFQLFRQTLEGSGVVFRELGEDLAVELDISFLQSVDES